MTTHQVLVPRWEWRTFGDQFAEAEAVLAAAPSITRNSADTYLLGPTPDVNAKVRNGQLDVKRLQRRDGDLELWSPIFKASFPLSGQDVDALFHHWQLPRPATSREVADIDALVALVSDVPGVTVASLRKARRQTELDGCSVEISTVTAGDWRVTTVAVESEWPDRIGPVVRRLGLSGRANENYVVGLRRVLEREAHQTARPGGRTS
jgi:exopolyphosphatase/guanosine-5'-triphosphate,3'-diphosphate pyrophosphatase